MVHIMHLSSVDFERIKNDEKQIEYRLNDEKIQKIERGDTIIFTNIDNDEQASAIVIETVRAHTFTELRGLLYKSGAIEYNDFNPQDMLEYYKREDEYRYGVVGIRLKTYKESVFSKMCIENPQDVVAEYIAEKTVMKRSLCLKNDIDNEHEHRGRKVRCGFAEAKSIKRVARKLNSIFEDNVLQEMAMLIRYKNNEISEEEFNSIDIRNVKIIEELLVNLCKMTSFRI